MRFRVPVAYAKLSGSSSYPDISGKVYFMRAQGGTVVAAEVWNVTDEAGKPAQGFKGFHILYRGDRLLWAEGEKNYEVYLLSPLWDQIDRKRNRR